MHQLSNHGTDIFESIVGNTSFAHIREVLVRRLDEQWRGRTSLVMEPQKSRWLVRCILGL